MNTDTLKMERLEGMLARFLNYGTSALGLALVLIKGCLGARALGGLSSTTIVMAGVALLIMLPVLRLALVLIVFLRERDYMFGMIAPRRSAWIAPASAWCVTSLACALWLKQSPAIPVAARRMQSPPGSAAR